MDYNKHYTLLIERAKNRKMDGYFEKHHVIPRCLGGNDSKDNLVALTPEEHYLAHQMLVKIYPNNHKLIKAAVMMTTHNSYHRVNNKIFGWLRRKLSESMSGDNSPARLYPEIFKEAANKRIGQKRSEDTKRNLSNALKGKSFTESHLLNLRVAAQRRKKPLDGIKVYMYDDTGAFEMVFDSCYEAAKHLNTTTGMIKGVLNGSNQHIRNKRLFNDDKGSLIEPLIKTNSSKGIPKTEEHIINQKKVLGIKHTCVHCGFTSSKSAINRYHNDRCKHNLSSTYVHRQPILKSLKCPYCNKEGKGSVMYRHHFDNCKIKGIKK